MSESGSVKASAEKEIFFQALDKATADERAAYLDQACGADRLLRRRVEDLLAQHFQEDAFMARTAIEPPASPPMTESIGSVIGRYKLLEKIGEGGFGVVYLAGQREPVKRRVALKVVKLGMDTRQVMARFEAERQALALMDHPNIAKVLDGGATETGRPYFVMELVRGVPITEYCDEHQLSTRQRLEIFINVCHAVQHAHQKGIIHRDLKPSNILVTLNDGQAVPKVIDFGVAKATQMELTEKTIVTHFHQFIGTPAYMSPEQAQMSSVDIDTRSDIYALGVLLYELLTGKTPFESKELMAAGLDEMRRTIREREPMRPSTRLSGMAADESSTTAQRRRSEPRQLMKLLRGDLDWIVMKCLEKDRARRYDTANGLAMDIQSHLGNEPVVARPPSAAYRFQKLVRRNKLKFATAAFALGVLLLAVLVSGWQAVKATRAERKAQKQAELVRQESEKARSVKEFLIQEVLPAHPKFRPEFYDCKPVLVAQIAQAAEGAFTNQPLTEADVRYALGTAYDGLDDYPNMALQMEKAFLIRSNRLGLAHPDTLLAAAGIAESNVRLDRLDAAEKLVVNALAAARNSPEGTRTFGAGCLLRQLGAVIHRKGRPAEAVAYHDEALTVLKETVGAGHPEAAEAMIGHNLALEAAGRREEAARFYEEYIRQWQQLHRTKDLYYYFLKNFEAQNFMSLGRPGDAVRNMEEVVPALGRMLGPDQSSTLLAELFLAQAYEQRGQTGKAAEIFSSLRRRAAKGFPERRARDVCHRAADFLARTRRYDEATSAFELLRASVQVGPVESPRHFGIAVSAIAATQGWPASAEFCRTNLELFPRDPAVWSTKASIFAYVGDAARYSNAVARALSLSSGTTNLSEQLALLRCAALTRDSLAPADSDSCAALVRAAETALPALPRADQPWSRLMIAAAQLCLSRVPESLDHAEKALAIERGAWTLLLKSICLSRLNRPDEARASLLEAQSIMNPPFIEPLGRMENFLTENQIFGLSLRREARTLAEKPLRDAVASLRAKFPANESLEVAQALEALGHLLIDEKRGSEAETQFRESLQIRRALQGNENTNTALALAALRESLMMQGKLAEAEPVARECVAINEKLAPDAWETCMARTGLSRSLLGQKKYAEAEPLLLADYKGLKECEVIPPEDGNRWVRGACTRLGQLYRGWDKPEKAAEWEQEGEKLRLAGVEAHLRKAAAGGEAVALKDLAWFLATCHVAEFRSGTNAIALAEKAIGLTNRNPAHLATLAAAHAEAGQFEKAVTVQKEAIGILGVRDDRSVFEDRLKLFEARTAYHQ